MKFLRTTVAVAAIAAALGSATAAQAARAYIGTYTPDPADPRSGANNHGDGIYLVNIDDATGAPSAPKLVAKSLSPTWITLSADHKFLYAVNEIASYGANKSGSITAYAVDGASGALKQLNVVDSGGSIPCFVSISGKFLLVANYTGGSYSVTRIKPDGSLGETTDVVKPGGRDERLQRRGQAAGHVCDHGAARFARPHDPARSQRPICHRRRCRARPDLCVEAGHQHRQA